MISWSFPLIVRSMKSILLQAPSEYKQRKRVSWRQPVWFSVWWPVVTDTVCCSCPRQMFHIKRDPEDVWRLCGMSPFALQHTNTLSYRDINTDVCFKCTLRQIPSLLDCFKAPHILTNLAELLYMCRLCFLSFLSALSQTWQSCRRAAFISLSAFVDCLLCCSCFLVQRAGRMCFNKMPIVAFRRQKIWFLFPVSVLNRMKYLIIVSPSDLILCLCFRCCGDRQLSFKHWLCVSQWSLRWIPPGVRQQGRLCWWIRWDRLWWVQMELMSGFIVLLSRKTTFNLLFLFHRRNFWLAWRLQFQHGWKSVGGDLPALPGRWWWLWLEDRPAEWNTWGRTARWPQSWSVPTLLQTQ